MRTESRQRRGMSRRSRRSGEQSADERGPLHGGRSSPEGGQRLLAVVVPMVAVVSMVTSCFGGPDHSGDSSRSGSGEVVSVQQENGGELVVDWNEGLTHEEQVEEIKLVNEVMTKHFGQEVLPQLDGGEWDLQTYLNQSGLPYPSNRVDGNYYYEVMYDFSDVEANQETQEKALAVLDELGLTPNEDLPTTYDEDRMRPVYVAGGEDEHGRVFLIRQLGDGAGIVASYSTRHSNHESMYEAHEANWDD